MSHTVILLIPAFNEESRIGDVVAKARQLDLDCEIVVVDDGSVDHTAAVAASSGATVLRHPFNLGYGVALQTGYKYALEIGAESLVQLDADGQHDPADAPRLLQPVVDGRSDLVLGSRFLGSAYQMGRLRTAGRELFRSIARWAGVQVTDPTSGFQAMNRSVLETYVLDSFPVDYPDVNVLVAASRSGLRVSEEPVEMGQGGRDSMLHGGIGSVYYVYKMLLSTWTAATGSTRKKKPEK